MSTSAANVLFDDSLLLVVAVQSNSKPGLSIKLTVSPPFTGYSRRSLLSASALPRKRSRCESAGGAPGWLESCFLIEAIVSVGETRRVNEKAGFVTLNTSSMMS